MCPQASPTLTVGAAAPSLAAIEARMGSDRQPRLAALLHDEARLIEAALAAGRKERQ